MTCKRAPTLTGAGSVSELIAAIDKHLALHNRVPKRFVCMANENDIRHKVISAKRPLSSKNNEFK